jgi:hypothetical protein
MLLTALLGTWRGEGHGQFPTMGDFDYHEEIRFTDLGGPIHYQQRAWAPASGELLHTETGIWRATDDGLLVSTIALPRVTEISEGMLRDGVIELAAVNVARGTGGAPLVATRRVYELDGQLLRYRVSMATDRVAQVTAHLAGTLRRG